MRELPFIAHLLEVKLYRSARGSPSNLLFVWWRTVEVVWPCTFMSPYSENIEPTRWRTSSTMDLSAQSVPCSNVAFLTMDSTWPNVPVSFPMLAAVIMFECNGGAVLVAFCNKLSRCALLLTIHIHWALKPGARTLQRLLNPGDAGRVVTATSNKNGTNFLTRCILPRCWQSW